MMTSVPFDWLCPDWPAPPTVRAWTTTRTGGVSTGAFAAMNLGLHSGDELARVAQNRAILAEHMHGARIAWLEQVHGAQVVSAEAACAAATPPQADASVATTPQVACAVMTADCLPVLFCEAHGRVVAAAHAGWRSLVGGVLEATVAHMDAPPQTVMAWLGPAIGPQAFEVGEDVRRAFLAEDADCGAAFVAAATPGKWWADLYALARRRLARAGVAQVYGGGLCTVADETRFFSWRRDAGRTGRMVSLIWTIR